MDVEAARTALVIDRLQRLHIRGHIDHAIVVNDAVRRGGVAGKCQVLVASQVTDRRTKFVVKSRTTARRTTAKANLDIILNIQGARVVPRLARLQVDPHRAIDGVLPIQLDRGACIGCHFPRGVQIHIQ